MHIYPAIDLKDGQCVRLRQGRADAVTVYGADPVAMARKWVESGADWLHVVDLDGAFQGRPVHQEVVARIVKAVGVPVEVGGGLRTDADIECMLGTGVARVILGTRACADPEALAAVVRRHGDRVAVGIDARNGKVQVRGWVETTDTTAAELARRAAQAGIATIIYTDTATDGMLKGPNVAGVRELCRQVPCRVIASGGISSVSDVARLRALEVANLTGVIVGKALYEGTVTVAELKRAAGGADPA